MCNFALALLSCQHIPDVSPWDSLLSVSKLLTLWEHLAGTISQPSDMLDYNGLAAFVAWKSVSGNFPHKKTSYIKGCSRAEE